MKKVKKEELEKLQQLNSEFVQAKTQLGDLEIQKSMIISNVQEIRSQFGELEQTLMKKYGENRIRRAFTYKALNKLIQGSAADMTKKSMLDLYKEGIVAHIQIHDELDISVESDKKAKRIIEIMETAVDLKVPNKVDYESGKTWGNIYD